MTRRILFTLLTAMFMVLLAACGGGGNGGGNGEGNGEGNGGEQTEQPATTGDAQRGEELFTSTTIGDANAPGCITCHSVEQTSDPMQPSPVGPSLYGIAGRAGERREGMAAEEYLRESIVEPNAYVVETFPEGVMYQNYGEDLTDEQINDLVAYLSTLQGD